MNPVLLHIYGPISIHAYGVFIAIGALITFYLTSIDPKVKKLLSSDEFTTVCQLFLLGGYIGGRVGLLLSQPESQKDLWILLKFWEPGFAALGGIIGIILFVTTYLYLKKISILSFADRLAMYGPISQSLGRLGCFFAGCCYGKPTTSWFGVTYTDPNHMAPLHCSLHPAQLYSAILLMGIFLFLYFIQQHRTNKAGVLFFSYLVLTGIERFLIDFIRWDRVFTYKSHILQLFSVYQWIALAISLAGTIGILLLEKNKD